MTQTALVWGANGGIGRAIAAALRQRHWTVIGVARDTTALDALVDHGIEADVADPFAVQQAVAQASQIAPTVDLMVYAVGDIASSRVKDMTPELFHRLIDANLTGVFLTVRHGLPLVAPEGHVIVLGAISENLRQSLGLSAYAAAKAGVEAFLEVLAKEDRKRAFTLIRPGAVATPFWSKVPFKLPSGALAPEAIAAAVLQAFDSGHRGTLDVTTPPAT